MKSPGLLPLAIAILAAALTGNGAAQSRDSQKNFIVILADDMGYGDIQPLGGSIPTPAINRMAQQGLLATDYYAPANLCTPSRAGLLTGRYAVRSGLAYEVILPGEERGLPLSEKTIPQVLKPTYVSGLFGKWHLGHTGPDWLPTHHGFDTYYGLPYSHDMLPLTVYDADAKTGKVKTSPPDYPNLQQQFYAHAEQFIEQNRNHPFFVELALSAPHLPEHPNSKFKATSKTAGPYGDVIAEIDSIVGRLLDKLKALSLDQNTVVILTSDNGPWFEGSPGPLRDRKGGMAYDGASRVPFIAWAPGLIPPGTKTSSIINGIDLLPTFCHLAGLALPAGVELDGRDISPVLTSGAPSPHDEIVLFNNEDPVGIRTQNWKYIDQTYYRGNIVNYANRQYKQLYDATTDISESYSVADTHPDVLLDMQARLKHAQETYAPFKKGVPPYFKKQREQSHPD
jgi:arylsulfatase A